MARKKTASTASNTSVSMEADDNADVFIDKPMTDNTEDSGEDMDVAFFPS